MQAYKQCLAFSSNATNPDYLFGIASNYLTFGNTKGAVEILGHILYSFPDYNRLNEIAFTLGLQSFRLLKYNDAIDFFRFCMNCIPPGLTEEDLLFRSLSSYVSHKSVFPT
jgi:hypothetical protein